MVRLLSIAMWCGGVSWLGLPLMAQFGPAQPTPGGAQQQPARPATMQPRPAPNSPSSTQIQNPFEGSVPSNDPPSATVSLSLQNAIERGLKQNVGLVLNNENTRLALAQQLRARSQLLPDVSGRVAETVEQVNLAAFGIKIPFAGAPSVVGPFKLFDARAYLTQSILDLTAINNHRAARENVKAARLSYQDARDLVVLLVASAYLQVNADAALVDEAKSEVDAARALYGRAADLLRNGLSPAIDALRAQVELQSEQTRLRGFENNFAKDKLSLARLIGLPLRQPFTLADQASYRPMLALGEDEAFDEALRTRSDYQALAAQVRAGELAKRAAQAARWPSLALTADYGDIGPSPASSHGTFSVSGAVRFPIFDGGRIRADIEQADAELEQRKAQLADLRGQIDFQVRSALLDMRTAADQVEVARSSLDLARQTLTQAQDRFSAGVADNIEVVQAQNSVAGASQTYIGSVYAHNVAKVALARAMGSAGNRVQQFLGGK